jgi:hypothetical protein
MACKMWRRQNLFTLCLAERARDRRDSIYAELNPPRPSSLGLLLEPYLPEPEPPSPEELAARRKAADDQARTELAGTIELVKVGSVATFAYVEKELAMMERLDAAIARDLKSLLYVRGIKSMSSSGAVAPSRPRLSKAA